MAGMWSLPEDLMIEILVRLTPKSVALCRCTCRNWCRILVRSRFLSLHVNRVIQTTTPNILFLSYNDDKIYATVFKSIDKFKKPQKLHIPRKAIKPRWAEIVNIVGSCNGLFCFSDYAAFVSIWNPATRKFLRFPYPRVRLQRNNIAVSMGFGFDPASEEYKLVRIAHRLRNEYEVMVYRPRIRSWRRIEDPPSRLCHLGNHSKATDINGALHWVGRKYGNIPDSFITSFCVKNELLTEIPLPDFGAKRRRYLTELSLGVHQGCQSAFLQFCHPKIEIWQMKDYGKKESWTRLFSIKDAFLSTKPLFFQNNGQLLLQKKEKALVTYEPMSRISSNLWVRGNEPYAILSPDAVAYVETLAGEGTKRKRKRTCFNTPSNSEKKNNI